MAAGKYQFKLDPSLPLKDLIRGLEPIFPVGSRGMSMYTPDGEDENGEIKFKIENLKPLQDEIHKEDENWDWDKNCFNDPEQFYTPKYQGSK
mmetsp:Transcript_10901/g.23776  ORF Transcript_10901/g.23776 Transcript_10901/m.23776 type:complete len:92 (+) Transcript_10901:54-329(+)|eukprot:CAMPEP_0183331914 /NCGR_PEP_ID=MMETSP0164_2-20130417/1210_1 /TAXON_ID=221442 /ORGANISM="Coccolithus pelagicus ssp braarudi, Strain PLY182g" /LENGTH=91 /DNA_ID=CAMNT_0025500517 /DNA_START=58 /DNA_END=333 /DNA_ORIENTATION=-